MESDEPDLWNLPVEPAVEAWDGDRMRRRVIGGTLTMLGVLLVLFEPVIVVTMCADCVAGAHGSTCGCHEQGASDWWGLINYPPRWDKLAVPMLIIGIAFVVTGIVVLIKPRRSRFSPP